MNYLFAAYTVIWIIFFVYATSLWNRQKKLARELESLRAQLEETKGSTR